MELTAEKIQAWLNAFTDAIEANKDYLSELDTPIGDGDHGNNMARGMAAYQAAFEKQQPATISDTLKILSMALISKVGGASGPLYGSAFMNMTKATKGLAVITSEKQLGEIVNQGLQGIQARGKAVAEDKTMVDVWIPVAAALKNGELTSEVIEAAKEHTKDLVAKKGRASYLGERAIGHIDPGAASSGILFKTLLDTIKD
ncbi:dihydroxyacetone kinase subunit DhaL [Enterococcus pallens]|uniref:phosphoenolpyruvate--glycerone phosphotransferase n=1 Tax=Enterococcus pallens ATCC BAA-351 TaxID=1158607 RepID=R2Q950_9ENTE|nr:dihydroxyacetone kinase subunit DhaL [Enterococcus pallens]EOH91778.1 dihydroxyacetone kinase, L subunit [Enterococcus pallens ATCC BAA-351]EOU25206.1 dihydroxyacetone kinase, L subunit [Enterococcus pallens ATCC BAA-351]OJG79995.1 dihydroxyacetone kinase, L subunit [Enterococcus pallens]